MLLWMEGFDWIASGTQGNTLNDEMRKYYQLSSLGAAAVDGVIANPNGDRNGNAIQMASTHSFRTNKLRLTGSGTSNVCIFGFFIRTPPSFSNNFRMLEIWSQAEIQCNFRILTGGTLQHQRGNSSTVATSTYAFSTSNDYYVEFKVVIDNSAGSIEMRVADLTAGDTNMSVEWTATSLNNEGLTTADEFGWDQMEFNSWGNDTILDDIYICDGSGSSNNDFLGNRIVETVDPTAEGANSDFTPSSGVDNALMVDEIAPSDEDTTYNTASTNGDIDTYVMENPAAAVNNIAGVQVQADMRVTQAEPRTVRLPVKSGTTTSEGSDQVIGTDEYSSRYRIVEEDPDTAAAWTAAGVNGMEVGVKRQA